MHVVALAALAVRRLPIAALWAYSLPNATGAHHGKEMGLPDFSNVRRTHILDPGLMPKTGGLD